MYNLQILHTVNNEQLECINSMDDYVERHVETMLLDTKKSWQPTDYLPDSSSPDFLDQARFCVCRHTVRAAKINRIEPCLHKFESILLRKPYREDASVQRRQTCVLTMDRCRYARS